MARQKGTGTRGSGVAGGGLVARIDAWEKLAGATHLNPTTKRIDGNAHIKPGSQNSRKGGRGKGGS